MEAYENEARTCLNTRWIVRGAGIGIVVVEVSNGN